MLAGAGIGDRGVEEPLKVRSEPGELASHTQTPLAYVKVADVKTTIEPVQPKRHGPADDIAADVFAGTDR